MNPIRFATGMLLLTLLVAASCKKTNLEVNPDNLASEPLAYWNKIQSDLKYILPDDPLNTLQFSAASRIAIDSNGVKGWLLSIPALSEKHKLKESSDSIQYSKKALIARTDLSGKIITSKWLSFTDDFRNVQLQTKNGSIELQSPVVNGYVVAWHPRLNLISQQRGPVVPAHPTIIELPEVIVVGVIPNNPSSGLNYNTLFSLVSFLDGGGGSGGWFYSNPSGTGAGGGSSGSYQSNPWTSGNAPTSPIPVTNHPIMVDYEDQFSKPAIDLDAYLKCFSAVPNAGAVCSIHLFTDIPVDADPRQLFNFNNGSPGHAFIQLTKVNGTQRVDQFIGFYPKTGWKVATNFDDLESKIVDNSQHEFNASISLSLTPFQLEDVISRAYELAEKAYDIDEYNCADFALDLFNWPQPFAQHLTVPLVRLPGSDHPLPTSRSPQGIYMKLNDLKVNNDPRAILISIPVKTKVGTSKGACQ